MIKALRKEIGGEWKAHRQGFGYRYEGLVDGKYHISIQRRAMLAPRYPDDDDTFVSVWRTEIDGRQLWTSSTTFGVITTINQELSMLRKEDLDAHRKNEGRQGDE